MYTSVTRHCKYFNNIHLKKKHDDEALMDHIYCPRKPGKLSFFNDNRFISASETVALSGLRFDSYL